jgi:hypothetical protein
VRSESAYRLAAGGFLVVLVLTIAAPVVMLPLIAVSAIVFGVIRYRRRAR